MNTPLDPGSGGPTRPLLLALELPRVRLGRAAQLAAERCALQLGDDGCLRRRRFGSGNSRKSSFFFVGKPLAKAEKDLQMVGFPYLCWCKGG